jgi:DNA-directed RNA polymerase specialized sigma24 family protein
MASNSLLGRIYIPGRMEVIREGDVVMDARSDVVAESRSSSFCAPRRERRKWTLTREAFDGLLAALGPDRESAGKKYLEVRSNLLRFFEWRGCTFPEDHADETINRVAKRVWEGEEIRNPTSYFLGTARMLLLEIHKERVKERQALSELGNREANAYEFEALEPRVQCLERCLGSLSAKNRELILQYYHGEKGEKIETRKGLSERFGVPLNTLRMRAVRIREKLLLCVGDCLKK